MIIQNIDVTTSWASLLDLAYDKRDGEPPVPAPQGASVYISAPSDFAGVLYGIDEELLDIAEEPATLLDGVAGDRFLSFEVDNLSTTMVKSDADVKLSIIIRTW